MNAMHLLAGWAASRAHTPFTAAGLSPLEGGATDIDAPSPGGATDPALDPTIGLNFGALLQQATSARADPPDTPTAAAAGVPGPAPEGASRPTRDDEPIRADVRLPDSDPSDPSDPAAWAANPPWLAAFLPLPSPQGLAPTPSDLPVALPRPSALANSPMAPGPSAMGGTTSPHAVAPAPELPSASADPSAPPFTLPTEAGGRPTVAPPPALSAPSAVTAASTPASTAVSAAVPTNAPTNAPTNPPMNMAASASTSSSTTSSTTASTNTKVSATETRTASASKIAPQSDQPFTPALPTHGAALPPSAPATAGALTDAQPRAVGPRAVPAQPLANTPPLADPKSPTWTAVAQAMSAWTPQPPSSPVTRTGGGAARSDAVGCARPVGGAPSAEAEARLGALSAQIAPPTVPLGKEPATDREGSGSAPPESKPAPSPDPVLAPQAQVTPSLPSGPLQFAPRAPEALPSAPLLAQLPTPVHHPHFGRDLGLNLSQWAAQGQEHVLLELNPLDMGPVAIHLKMQGSTATLDFGATVQATRDLIEQALPDLASALQQQGFTLSGGSVGTELPTAPPPPPATANAFARLDSLATPGGATTSAAPGQGQGPSQGQSHSQPQPQHTPPQPPSRAYSAGGPNHGPDDRATPRPGRLHNAGGVDLFA